MAIHICHICQCGGGVETYILGLLRYCDRDRFKHTVLCYDDGTLAVKSTEAGADVVLIPMVREISPLKDTVSLTRILGALRRIQPDIIHAHSGKGGIFGRVSGTVLRIPVGLTPNAFSYLGQAGMRRRLVMTVEKLLAYTPSLMIASSPSEAARAISEVGWNPQKVTADFSNSISISDKVVTHSDKKDLNVLMIGRPSFQKNPEMLLRVARLVNDRNPSIKFTILGAGYSFADPSGDIANNLARIMRELNLAEIVDLKPWGAPEAAETELLRADIYASTSRYESFGYTTAEAMEKCLPVVATKIDGSIDLVDPGKTGYLVEIDDDQQMAEHICQLAADWRLRKEMGDRGRDRVISTFDITKNITCIESIYDSLLNGRK